MRATQRPISDLEAEIATMNAKLNHRKVLTAAFLLSNTLLTQKAFPLLSLVPSAFKWNLSEPDNCKVIGQKCLLFDSSLEGKFLSLVRKPRSRLQAARLERKRSKPMYIAFGMLFNPLSSRSDSNVQSTPNCSKLPVEASAFW